MLISYRATVAYRQRFCLECNLGSCPFMFYGCIPHHLNIKCKSPPPLTYIISRLELSRVSFQGRLISTSKKRNINYQSFTDVIIGGVGWGGGSPPGDNYPHRKLICQHQYIYTVRCTFIIGEDGVTASIRVRYLAHATP